MVRQSGTGQNLLSILPFRGKVSFSVRLERSSPKYLSRLTERISLDTRQFRTGTN